MALLDKTKEAQEKLREVQIVASRINEILIKTSEVILTDEEENPIISLTAEQKTQLKAEYEKAKTRLSEAVAQLL